MFPTRLDIKTAHASKLPFESNLDTMIQEMQDRLYEAGLAPGSRADLEVDFSTARVTWNEVEVVQLPVDGYDGLAGVRDQEVPSPKRSYKVRDIEIEHQNPGAGSHFFVDRGIHNISGTDYRIYQVPRSLETSTEKFWFRMKVQSPTIAADTDQVNVKNLHVAKLGLLAIGYEDQGDPRAPSAMATFLAHANQGAKRLDGNKHRYMGLDLGLRHRPTNRM